MTDAVDTDSETDPVAEEVTFVTHLLELRDRLLKIVLVVTLIFACLFPFANYLYSLLAEPLLAHMPSGSSMIAVEVISPFLTPLKMSLYAALFIGMPFLLYQAWSFIAPGLYSKEKRLAVPLLISSVILFYAGVAFAYFAVFPLVFQFLIGVAPEGVAVMTDISKYLDFVLALFFAFGLAFEVPVATIILIATGITTADALVEKRPYIIVGAFVIGMLLTPPDIISQVMLALPMWALFELGIIMSRMLLNPDDEEDGDEIEDDGNNSAPAAVNSTSTTATASETSAHEQTPSVDTGPAPRGYSEAAYPDDFEPLNDDELEAELDAAEEWEEAQDDEDEDDDEQTNKNNDDAKSDGRADDQTPDKTKE